MATLSTGILRRRGLVIGVGGAALLLLVGLVVVGRGLGGDERDTESAFAAVPKVPKDRLAAVFAPALPMPAKCDDLVSAESVTKLAPKAKTGENRDKDTPDYVSCVWRSNGEAEDVGGKERVLQAKITRSESMPGALEAFRRERDTAYVYYRDRDKGKKSKDRWSKPENLAGVGDEAFFYGYEDFALFTYVTVVLRVKNITVQVEYFAEDYSGGRQILPSWESQRPHVLEAAANVAQNLGSATGREPKITQRVAGAPPIQKLPPPCGMVTKATLDKLGGPKPGAPVYNDREPGTDEMGLQSRTEIASCGWYRDDHLGGFKVESILTPDEVPGMGADIARRQHLNNFPGLKGDKTFSLLSGPGEGASIRWIEPKNCPTRPKSAGCAVVLFRIRNVLTSVWYAGATKDGEPLSYDEMSRRAYAIATDVAKAMPVG